MKPKWIVALAALVAALPSVAFELTLFDVELRSATPASLHAAALKAGARLIKTSGGHRIYDASRIGLPGAARLETLFDGDRFVVAAYSFNEGNAADLELRKLLVGRYGDAHETTESGRRYEIDLRRRYVEAAAARWDVDPPMELVYTTMAWGRQRNGRYGHSTRLTYVNRPLFDEVQKRAAAEAKEAERTRAKQLKGVF